MRTQASLVNTKLMLPGLQSVDGSQATTIPGPYATEKSRQTSKKNYTLCSDYQLLNGLPVTIDGKVDHKSLLAMGKQLVYPPSSLAMSPAEDGKKNKVLHKVIQLFKTLLELPEPHRAHNNSFEIGG